MSAEDRVRAAAKEILFKRLRSQRGVKIGRWTREELYERGDRQRRTKAIQLLETLPGETTLIPMLASAADAGCRLLLSEDFREGFFWSGITVTNPFSPNRHFQLEALPIKS